MTRSQAITKVVSFLVFLFVLQIALSYIFIRSISLNITRTNVNSLVTRVQNDIVVKDGTWDTSRYAADPDTPHPDGSSGFPQALYIVTNDGFVIERNQPIHGLLDSSDFKKALTYNEPQTIKAVTNETWRIQSLPIGSANAPTGVIVVSYYSPRPEIGAEIDQKLKDNLNLIQSQVQVNGDVIDTSKIDIRNIHYDVSFEIINHFNKVLINNGRTPSTIDASYVADQLSRPTDGLVKDNQTKNVYLVSEKKLTDSHGKTIGIVVAGQPIISLETLLQRYLVAVLIVTFILVFPLSLLVVVVLNKELQHLVDDQTKVGEKDLTLLHFDKKTGKLSINNTTIQIPYDTNQYYLCDALFSQPKKRWELDELLERFGEEVSKENGRKVYDAMLAVNRKSGYRLIVNQGKTYQINPDYILLLKK